MASYPDILKRRRKNKVAIGQDNIFSRLGADEVVGMMDEDLQDVPGWTRQQIMDGEYDATGMYITDHPMDDVAVELLKDKNTVAEINEVFEDEDASNYVNINMIGVIMGIEEKQLPNGSLYIVRIEDRSGRMELALWDDKYKAAEKFMVPGNIIQCVGNIGMTKTGTKRMYTKQLHLIMERPKEGEVDA